jgi:glycosyltransferase involved in cell wall biosynthesis
VIATSPLEAAELRSDGIDPSRIGIRANGIDVDLLLPLPSRGAFRAMHAIPQDARLVVSLGRIARKKGLADLVAAIAAVPDLHAAIVGPDDRDGALEQVLQIRADRGLTERVHVVPRGAWGPEKAQVFADADVFCLPSVTENFGIAAAEAAAVGLPVVVSEECGVAEWLEPASSRVVPLHDIDGLAKALDALTSGPEAHQAARAGASRLRRDLSWAGLAPLQIATYRAAQDAAGRLRGWTAG